MSKTKMREKLAHQEIIHSSFIDQSDLRISSKFYLSQLVLSSAKILFLFGMFILVLFVMFKFFHPGGVDLYVKNSSGNSIESITIFYREGTIEISNLKVNETRKIFLKFSSETGISMEIGGKKKKFDLYIVEQFAKKLEIIINSQNAFEWIYEYRLFLSKLETERGVVVFK